MPTIEEWYRGIPPITRAWFTASLVTSILFTTGVPVVQYLPLNWDLILHRFEVWRLLTGFIVFGGLSFNILITYYMMCQYVRALEVNYYPGVRGAAELLFVTMFGMLCILVTSYFYPLLPSVSLLSFFIYIWSRKDPHEQIVIYGFTFQRWHLPAVMFGLQLIMRVSFDPVFAILIGHLWVFLTEVVPRVYHKTLVAVPDWWYEGVESWWPAIGLSATGGGGRVGGRGAGAGAAAATEVRIPRANWMQGPGHRLDQ